MSQLATPLYGGRYEILSLIGVGGGGSVYRARDVELDEIVALKVLRKELLRDAESLERFRNEVRLSRRVTHRNVARMFDIGEHEGERFLTMELVNGESLSQRIAASADGKGHPLPIFQIAALIDQVCAGLEAAHQCGIVHCDLKPDNLLLSSDEQGERVVITDFGIARAFKQPTDRPADPRKFDGTPMYVSPESVEGSRIDSRADIYSLGVVLYELLVGQPPWSGDNAIAIVAARVLRPPPDPREVRPSLPSALAEIVLRCLARDPAQRFARASHLGAALREAARHIAEEPTLVRNAGTQRKRTAPPHPISTEYPAVDEFTTAPQPVSGTGHAVALLPLRNEGPAADDDLVAGLWQELADAVSALPGVRVLRHGALAQTNLRNDAALAIARELHAALLCEGSLQRAGDRLRITLRVQSAADGHQIFFERLDCAPGEVLRISDTLSAVLADTLGLPRAKTSRVLHVVGAVEQYLRARYLYGRSERASLEESVRLFEQVMAQGQPQPAPELLMNYALARSRLWFFGDAASGEIARDAAERVVAAAPHRGESHLALATVRFQGADLRGAVQALAPALAQAPELADAHDLLGRIMVETGPLREGLRQIVYARALDPGLFRLILDQSRVTALLGDFPRAYALLDEGPLATSSIAGRWVLLGRLCLWTRDRKRAEQLLRHPDMEHGLYPRARLLLQIVAEQARVDPREVLFEAQGSDKSSPRGRAFFYQLQAELFSFYRHREQAVRSLGLSVDAGLTDLLFIDRCPLLAELTLDPRLHALRRVVFDRAQAVRDLATSLFRGVGS